MEVFHTDRISERDFARILSVLRRGGVIGFPTDTAYGLGADPFNEAAIDRIFAIKGRAEAKPILLIVGSRSMAGEVARTNKVFERVADTFWPGPLTIVLPALPSLPRKLTAGTSTIGVRFPEAPFAVALSGKLGRPITATSANRSGMPAAIAAEEVSAGLGDSIDVLIDGGPLPFRPGSTVIDLTADPPVLLREGPISLARLQEVFEGRMRSAQ
jgi:L-threonylcarbamoyladenylate synthase